MPKIALIGADSVVFTLNVQGLVVEGALTGKKEQVYHAAMFDPHTSAELTLDDLSMC